MQKVVSVNINTSNVNADTGYHDFELDLVNDYLKKGYEIKETIKSVAGANNLYCINLTFILEKDETSDMLPPMVGG